jgi:hypothetical protein
MSLVGKSEENRPLGKPRHRWVDNNKIDLEETGRVARTGFIRSG